MHRYHINIFFSDDDGGYIADIPDLRYCTAYGETAAEALTNVEEAMQRWLDEARETGEMAPEPSYRPERYKVSRDS